MTNDWFCYIILLYTGLVCTILVQVIDPMTSVKVTPNHNFRKMKADKRKRLDAAGPGQTHTSILSGAGNE